MAALPNRPSAGDYGGSTKANAEPVVDPSTDLDATGWNALVDDVVGLGIMSPRAFRSWVGHATTPAEPASNAHDSQWGNATAVRPTVVRQSTGNVRIAWPVTVEDAKGVPKTLNFRFAIAFAISGTVFYHLTCSRFAANIIDVNIQSAVNVASDGVGVTFVVLVF